jgi:hypothetical protein
MVTVRLFTSKQGIGFIRFDEAKHQMEPEDMLPDDSIEVIREDLEAGRMNGLILSYRWYRQATPFFPSDSAKSCPCDEDVSGTESQISG